MVSMPPTASADYTDVGYPPEEIQSRLLLSADLVDFVIESPSGVLTVYGFFPLYFPINNKKLI
jgi:hypothetical protein